MTPQNNISEIQNKIGKFQAFLEADPKNSELLLSLGDLYHSISDFDQASDYYQQSLEISNSDIAKSRLASIKISQHQFAEAETMLKELITDGPINPALEFNLGLAQYQQEKWKDALKHFKLVLDAGIESGKCLSYITRCYHQSGDMEQAKAYCTQWVENTKSSESKGYLALLEMDDLNHEKSRELAQEVLKSDPENADAAIVMGNYQVENQDIENAVEYYNTVLKANPKHPRALFGLGLTHLYEKNYNEAINLMESASNQMPNDTGVKIAIGWAKITNDDIKGAEQAFRDAIDIDRNFSEGHGGLSYTLVLQGQLESAKKEMKAAYRLDKNGFGVAASMAAFKSIDQGHEVATKFLAETLERPAVPGQKPMIEHIQTYLNKQQSKTTTNKK